MIAIGLTSTADPAQRLKLLYTIHLPPLLCLSDIESPARNEDGAEIAAEATDFFENVQQQTLNVESPVMEETPSPTFSR